MKVSGVFLVLFGLQRCQPAVAGSMFRSEIDGRVEFSDRQCQPVKRQAACAQEDGEPLARASLQKQCATPASDADKPSIASSAQDSLGKSTDGPTRLALK